MKKPKLITEPQVVTIVTGSKETQGHLVQSKKVMSVNIINVVHLGVLGCLCHLFESLP
jgi:hypothetical protein